MPAETGRVTKKVKQMMRATIAMMAFGLPLGATAQLAQSNPLLSYDYVEPFYAHVSGSSGLPDGDGFGVGFSRSLTEAVFVRGNGSYTTFDRYDAYAGDDRTARVDQHGYLFTLGVGYAWPVSDFVDIVGVASAAYSSLSTEIYDGQTLIDGSEDDFGYLLEAEVRAAVTPWLELFAAGSRIDTSESDTFAGVGLRVLALEGISIGLRADFVDNATLYRAGLRFQY
jgi:hypothetical protein